MMIVVMLSIDHLDPHAVGQGDEYNMLIIVDILMIMIMIIVIIIVTRLVELDKLRLATRKEEEVAIAAKGGIDPFYIGIGIA